MNADYSQDRDAVAEHDTALHGLLGMADDQLTDLMASEFALARQQAARSEARMLAYLDDLAAVLRMPCGSGLRVVRHWLDAACASERISGRSDTLPALAALFDYARDRMADVALADPASHVRLQLQGARLWATARAQTSQDGQGGQAKHGGRGGQAGQGTQGSLQTETNPSAG